MRVCLQGEDCLCAAYRLVGEHVPGGLAEYVKVPAANVRRLPDHVSYEEAAAFMLTNMTAWRIQLHIVGSTMANRAESDTVVRLLFEGRLGPIIDEVVPLKDGAAAQQRLAAGGPFGTIVLQV